MLGRLRRPHAELLGADEVGLAVEVAEPEVAVSGEPVAVVATGFEGGEIGAARRHDGEAESR